MSDYRIITDSNTDLTQEQTERLDLAVIPMSFTIGDDSLLDYPDERDLSSHEFYRRIAAGETSTTNQISIATFTETFEPYLAAGQDVLYLGFSSGLSGTYNNSVIAAKELAAKYPQRRIATADTLAASMGEGLLVYHAAMMKRGGASLEEVRSWMEQNRNRMHHWFTVDDLNHLKRGGRISGASALVGTMLGIKPVMHFDDQGHIILMEKIRGRKQSLDSLISHMEKTCIEPDKQMIFISHSDSPEGCEYVASEIKRRFGVNQIETAPIGPVIGAHTGTGTVALFYLGQDREYEQQQQ
ncbi:DegV domain-containing protein [Caprobacter fermentans]|uniref:DegV domain-containing protein n=1 Tax=Caproicibacter fermentans TaxID=2576756 RepID=A0A6N8I506_9FIRM|nr:DegV family protein [Caproicibacter fermentans]MVB12593.1 DegV domain-containing protein [Caproicibacter fermentans]